MNWLKKAFDTNDREIKKYMKKVKKINELEHVMADMPGELLRGKTEAFKERFEKGETLDELLIEAFAVVREASKRRLSMRHFDVQLVGGMILHDGNIAEMKTGEGKTLVSTLPVYLNALAGKGVHVVTVNDYLARRDAEEMKAVYEYLGLSVGLNVSGMTSAEKQEAYQCDVIYGTNNEYGFDYLRDNMVAYPEEKVQRGLPFAVVDEVDSILVDEARTPLIISGQAEKSTSRYLQANAFSRVLKEEEDYVVDEKDRTVLLTDLGVSKAESYFGVDNLYALENTAIIHHINQALQALFRMKKDVDYVVQDEKIKIVDQFTGRIMEGRRFSEGLHQAIEAKEGVVIQNESMTLATITFQNYFRMYEKLAGMTGTAKTEEEEFRDIYNMNVLVVPTNKPIARKDRTDLIFAKMEQKFQAVVEDITTRFQKGQPVLVGTANIETSETIAALLKKKRVPHHVLNAKQHEKEADIIANAGNRGSVTIATNMAGRGTDIKLGEGVKELGGLYVIGTERHESRRIDNQLRGRSGRQGDPGETVFYLSLEDEVMVRFGSEKMKNAMVRFGLGGTEPIESKMVTRAVESAQKQVEGNHFDARKQILKYDEVMKEQRDIMYKQRDEVLCSTDVSPIVDRMIEEVVHHTVDRFITHDIEEEWDVEGLSKQVNRRLVGYELFEMKVGEFSEKAEINEHMTEKLKKIYEEKRNEFGENYPEVEKTVLLRFIDQHWMEHIDAMSQLRQGIHLRGYGQNDPLREYQMEGYQMFEEMVLWIEEESVRTLLQMKKIENTERKAVQGEAVHEDQSENKTKKPVVNQNKTGRNEPCPCGSGKKYKKCCGV